jgi:hypothetical protein
MQGSMLIASSERQVSEATMRTSMQQLITIARYLARKTVRAEWKAQGRKVQYINIRELTQASDLYLREHKAELMKQAWKHPAVVRHRQQQRQRLAQRAVISAIGQKGQRVNSIAPSELQKLIAAYVEDHPELRECGCF